MATYCPLGLLLRKVRTSPQSARQSPTAAAISERFGEKISTNPFPFTSAEKLETQKGIKKSLNFCQKPSLTSPVAVVLKYNANPIITLNPSEVSHSLTLESKYRTSTTQYQMK